MKISVVVTTYNLSRYIEECLNSILQQTQAPFEVILADDSSTDNTVDLAKLICPELIVVKQNENCGALLNTLSGLNRATGDVIAFIDGDDTWPKDKLERVKEQFVQDEHVFLVTHAHRRVDANGRPTGATDQTHKNVARILRFPGDEKRQIEFRNSILLRRGLWLGSAYSMRRSSIDLETFNRLIQLDLNARYAYLDLVLGPFVAQTNPNGRIVYLEDVVFDYRLHEHNSAASHTMEKQLLAIKRGRSTNLVTRNILRASQADSLTIQEYEDILREYDFLEALYAKRIGTALRHFFGLLTHFYRQGNLLKEFARLVIVCCVGPVRFLQLK